MGACLLKAMPAALCHSHLSARPHPRKTHCRLQCAFIDISVTPAVYRSMCSLQHIIAMLWCAALALSYAYARAA